MERLVKLDFEDILKHDGMVLCVHSSLKDEKYSKPLPFNDLIYEIGKDFGPGICKNIFKDGEWYISTLDSDKTLSSVIDMNKYKRTRNVKESRLDIDKDDKEFTNMINFFEELLNNNGILSIEDTIERLDEIDNNSKGVSKHVNSFEDINKIVTLKRPKVEGIEPFIIDKLLDTYINNKFTIKTITGDDLGELISFGKDTITIKLFDLDLYNSMKKHYVSFILFNERDFIDLQSIIIHEEKDLRL